MEYFLLMLHQFFIVEYQGIVAGMGVYVLALFVIKIVKDRQDTKRIYGRHHKDVLTIMTPTLWESAKGSIPRAIVQLPLLAVGMFLVKLAFLYAG